MSITLVTGGHGFVGSRLAKALVERGDRVRVADQARPAPGQSGLELAGIADQVELMTVDLANPGAADAAVAGVSRVFHLAAQTLVGPAMADPAGTFAANVEATWRMLEACRQHQPERVVIASSDKAYGSSDQLPYREGQSLNPGSPYEASKAAADLISLSYWTAFEMPVAVTRFANIYGGGDLNFSRLVPEVMAAVVTGRRPVIRSDGSPERDFLHVDDAVAAYLAIESAPANPAPGSSPVVGQAFNAGGGRPYSVREMLELLAEVTGQPVEPEFRGQGNPHGEIDRQYVDASRLTSVTGWRPRVELVEGLRQTYDWYSSNANVLPQ